MFNLGMGEITVILVLLLLFVGPSKLPELASGLGKLIRQVRKTTADVKNEIVLDDSFRKPFEELRDAVTLAPEELKRRDQIKESLAAVRKQAEELARAATTMEMDDGSATPPPETARPRRRRAGRQPAGGQRDRERRALAAPFGCPSRSTTAPPPPLAPVPPMAPPMGTFPRSPTPAPLPPGRLGGGQRVTPPISFPSSDRANITQVLSEEDLRPVKKGAPPPLPPPLPGVAPPPPPGTKKA